jgi:hypothetical protein
MIPPVVDEVPEADAPPEVSALYARIRTILDSTFVPTVYRRLACYPDVLHAAVNSFESVAERVNPIAFADDARSQARRQVADQIALAPPVSVHTRATIARYRAANPINLLFGMVTIGADAQAGRPVMTPPLPVSSDIWDDIKSAHGGPIIPGLWRDMAPSMPDVERLWRQTRLVADQGVIASARDQVRDLARRLLTAAGVPDGSAHLRASVPNSVVQELSWFPTGIATMVAEGELLDQLTDHHR